MAGARADFFCFFKIAFLFFNSSFERFLKQSQAVEVDGQGQQPPGSAVRFGPNLQFGTAAAVTIR